jgi:hypothetical protein
VRNPAAASSAPTRHCPLPLALSFDEIVKTAAERAIDDLRDGRPVRDHWD